MTKILKQIIMSARLMWLLIFKWGIPYTHGTYRYIHTYIRNIGIGVYMNNNILTTRALKKKDKREEGDIRRDSNLGKHKSGHPGQCSAWCCGPENDSGTSLS